MSPYIGEGTNRWSAVHRVDAATLFRIALEEVPAGTVLHAAAEKGMPVRVIAEVIGLQLDLPVTAIAPADAGAHFDWLAGILAADGAASSAITQELLGWHPSQPGLIEDPVYRRPRAVVPAVEGND